MSKQISNYIDGSAARKIDYDVYQDNKILKQKQRQRKNNNTKIKAIFFVFTIVLLCSVAMYRYASITELNYNIEKNSNKYLKMKNDNLDIRVKIDNETSLSKIKEVAKNNLGMIEPASGQVVYVNLPKNDFTQIATNNRAENNNDNKTDAIDTIVKEASKLTHLFLNDKGR